MIISSNVYLAVAAGSGQDRRWHCTSEAWRIKPKRLEHATADFLLEALLSAMPIDFRKPADIKAITNDNDCFIFSATLDRASNNLLSCRWLCGWIESELKQPKVIFHPELCNLHGTALVKNRATCLKDVAASLYSFTRWLRNSKNHSRLVDGISERLDVHLSIKPEERPAGSREQSLSVVKAIYGDFAPSSFGESARRFASLSRHSYFCLLKGSAT